MTPAEQAEHTLARRIIRQTDLLHEAKDRIEEVRDDFPSEAVGEDTLSMTLEMLGQVIEALEEVQ